MQVTFWGTRGSIPSPGPDTVRYGGNTSCIEVRTAAGHLFVLDCGSGIRNMARHLMRDSASRSVGSVLMTHTHWDHIQGFPFFRPLAAHGSHFTVYGPAGAPRGIAEVLAGQMTYSYWPVGVEEFASGVHYVDLPEGSYDIGGATITSQYLNHPGVTFGYRIEADGVVVVYVTDHEPFTPTWRRSVGAPDRLETLIHDGDRRHARFMDGADLVIHDAQYTGAEYDAKHGWGHSPVDYAIDIALAAGVRRLALFHHDPDRTDDEMDRLQQRYRELLVERGADLDVFFAAEGQRLTLGSTIERSGVGHEGLNADPLALPTLQRTSHVMIVEDDDDVADCLVDALRGDGYRLSIVCDGDEALRRIRAERPDLILLDVALPGRDGVSVVQALRADPDSWLHAMPVVFLTAIADEAAMGTAFAAGASDFMAIPFLAGHVRARVRNWLARSQRAHHEHESG